MTQVVIPSLAGQSLCRPMLTVDHDPGISACLIAQTDLMYANLRPQRTREVTHFPTAPSGLYTRLKGAQGL